MKRTDPDYITKHFPGVVQFVAGHRWQNPETGTWFSCVAGKVTILEDTNLVGFKTRSGDSNWIARIDGPSGMSINVLGCKVHSVTAYSAGLPSISGATSPDVFIVP
jgi:hypothetical protein